MDKFDKVFYVLQTIFYAFMIWSLGDSMFKYVSDNKSGMASICLLGVIGWTLMLIEVKDDVKKKIEEKNKKDLDVTKK